VEVARSTASTITIGGSPTVSSFTFVSATTSSLTFSFSFNPQGETVQYGVEIRTPQDQFVKADLAGQTSTAQSGAVHQVTGLSSGTSYKARLILAYGTLTMASSWITVTTN
jgi:hypothetical protein